jgi:hypothetical protein
VLEFLQQDGALAPLRSEGNRQHAVMVLEVWFARTSSVSLRVLRAGDGFRTAS